LGGWDVYFFIPMSWIFCDFSSISGHGPMALHPVKPLEEVTVRLRGDKSIQKISVAAPQILSPYLVKQNCQASRLLFAKIC
jgi:hypothetical protein